MLIETGLITTGVIWALTLPTLAAKELEARAKAIRLRTISEEHNPVPASQIAPGIEKYLELCEKHNQAPSLSKYALLQYQREMLNPRVRT